jgi:hypothetical protein
MSKQSTVGLGYHYGTTVGRSTSRPPSKAAGNTPSADGCWLKCILWHRGRTNFCILQSLRITGKNHRWPRAYQPWSSVSLSSVGAALRCALHQRVSSLADSPPRLPGEAGIRVPTVSWSQPFSYWGWDFNISFLLLHKNLVLIWLDLVPNAALSREQLDGFMAYLFDKGMPTAHLDNLSLPFSRENPPP